MAKWSNVSAAAHWTGSSSETQHAINNAVSVLVQRVHGLFVSVLPGMSDHLVFHGIIAGRGCYHVCVFHLLLPDVDVAKIFGAVASAAIATELAVVPVLAAVAEDAVTR